MTRHSFVRFRSSAVKRALSAAAGASVAMLFLGESILASLIFGSFFGFFVMFAINLLKTD